LRILLLEDNPDHAVLIADLFSLIMKVEINNAYELHEGLSLINSARPGFDIVLCDLDLPDSSTESTIQALKELQTDIPVVILTALSSYEKASNLLSDGIQDYIPKDELSPSLLHRVCVHAIRRKKHQIELERSTNALNSFCGSVTRDLRSPINRITNVTDTLRSKLVEGAVIQAADIELINSVERSAETSLGLIDGVYNYMSVDYRVGASKEINIVELLKVVEQQLKEAVDIDFDLIVADLLPRFYGNPELISLMFYNLIDNAIRYNRNVPTVSITGVLHKDSQQCSIAIQDNGIGIENRYFDEIFKPFVRLNISSEFSGVGVGLSVVKRIVESHDGAITVSSQPDRGTIFTVTMPIHS